MRGAGAVALLAGLLLLGGCGSDAPTIPGPSSATGRFDGSDGQGIGIAVDFLGFDADKRAIQEALGRDRARWSVGIVSIVNRSKRLAPVPVLTATAPDGRSVPLDRATRILRNGSVVSLPDPGPYVPVEGALTIYVLFAGRVDEIRRVEMRVGARAPVRLTPRPPSPAGGG